MKILGIDPGYERLGIAILEKNIEKQNSFSKKEIVLFSECFKTASSLPFPERLSLIGKRVDQLIKKYKPEILSIETLFLNTNQKTVMQVAEVRGVIIYLCKKNKMKIFEASPPQIKIAITGYGKADKKQVIKMVNLLVDLRKESNSDDELDAIAIALTASASLK
jgi:crossover junction endodeoxyribonuclease RuvC